MRFIVFTMLSIFSSSFSIAQLNTGNLIIDVKGVKNDKGKILISIYNSEKGFPSSSTNAVYLVEGVISKNTSRIVVENIPFGIYAVSLIHDENKSKKLETNFLGIPKEGIGMSNDARGTFGPPTFNQAKFNFSKNEQVEKINLVYY